MALSSNRPVSGRAAPGEDCQPKTKGIQRYSSRDAFFTLYGLESTLASKTPMYSDFFDETLRALTFSLVPFEPRHGGNQLRDRGDS
jgi:hypothetical protein